MVTDKEYPVEIGEIEKDLPIPPPRKSSRSSLPVIYPFDRMDVGDSFEVRRTSKSDSSFYNRVTSRLRLEASRLGIRIRLITTEHDPDTHPTTWTVKTIRVWRIL